MHTLYFDHTRTRHQSQSVSHEDLAKARHPLEKKKKTRKSVIMLMNPCSSKKKKKKKERGKSINDGQVSLFTHAHDQNI